MTGPSIHVPELKPRPLFSGYRVARTKKWLEQLPLADVDRAAQLTLERLVEVNQIEWRPRDRLNCLNGFVSPLGFLQQALSKKYLNLPMPLRERAMQRAQITIELQAQLAIGYRAILDGASERIDRATLTRSIRDYLQALNRLLLQLSQLYSPLPDDFWRQAHRAFGLAIARNVQDEILDGDISISTLYKRLMTLGATDLRRFRQSEQSDIFGALAVWCRELKLTPAPFPRPSSMQVQFSRSSNDAPRRVGPSDGGNGDNDLFALDIEPLSAMARRQLLSAEPEPTVEPGQGLDEPCLRRLLRIWEGPWRRQFPRTPASGEIEITIGLGEIHRKLGSRLGESIYQRAQFRTEDGRAQWVQPGDPWARTPYVANEIDELEREERLPQPEPRPNWQLVDTSAGGLCIHQTGQTQGALRIGDLLYLTSHETPATLGVVRWLKCNPGSGLEFGVQILATDPEPVILSPAKRGSSMAPGMHLPENRAGQIPESLVTPLYPFQEGMAVKVYQNDQEQRLRLVRILENTGAFSQFRIELEPLGGTRGDSEDSEESGEELRLWPGATQ